MEKIWQHWAQPKPDAPPNVLLSAWLPQLDILAHPNVKLFITHGGAGSLQEALCYKTPMVGIPFGSVEGHEFAFFYKLYRQKT
jgi:glucuronosyltransferase